MDYSFGNFKLNITAPLARVDGGLQRETTRAPRDQELVVGTYNVENLDPGDGGAFARHAQLIVGNLRRRICWRSRRSRTTTAHQQSVTDASVTWGLLIDAIGPLAGRYQYRQIDPVDDQDGGEPGGNIRVGFCSAPTAASASSTAPAAPRPPPPPWSTTRGTAAVVQPGPGRPQDPAFADTRKSLAGEFRLHGKKVFVVANHFSSKTADDPLFGRVQPPVRASEPPATPRPRSSTTSSTSWWPPTPRRT